MDLTLWFDGAAEPNPGLGSWGWVLSGLHELPDTGSGALPGTVTNNVAEYTALGKGLRWLCEQKLAWQPTDRLTIHGDSQLVLNQISGEWQTKSETLVPYRDRCRTLLDELKAQGLAQVVSFWVPRERNVEADALSVAAWEEAAGRPFPRYR